MPKILKEEIKTAIEYLEECRDMHIDWAVFAATEPQRMKNLETIERIAGNKEFHHEWIDKYNFVINVLERIK